MRILYYSRRGFDNGGQHEQTRREHKVNDQISQIGEGARSKKTRSANTAVELPAEIPKWMQTREEWRRLADSPAKRRTFIKKICRRIAEEFKPEKIILFGSYAYGKPRPDSDIDLLVVMPFEGDYFLQAFRIRQRLALSLPMDLLVRTPKELQYRLDIGDSFMREIVEHGKVMYEANHVSLRRRRSSGNDK